MLDTSIQGRSTRAEAVAGDALLDQGHECACGIVRVEMYRRNEVGWRWSRAVVDVAGTDTGSIGGGFTGVCSSVWLGQHWEESLQCPAARERATEGDRAEGGAVG